MYIHSFAPPPLEWLFTCQSFNMKVMMDDVKISSVYGERNDTLTNDVVVFSNVFSKTNYLPSGFARIFPNLERFYVASSRVKFIHRKNFVGLSKLKTLDLRFNEIKAIPSDALLDLFNLEVLTISGNLIQTLPSILLVSLMKLRYFDASDNEITDFDDEIFSQNSKLQEILLENNRIESIKSNFRKLNDIGFIDLRDNVCISSFFLRDPDYPLISKFQKDIDQNCTKVVALQSSQTKLEQTKLEWDMCPRLMQPTNTILCLIERKFTKRGVD